MTTLPWAPGPGSRARRRYVSGRHGSLPLGSRNADPDMVAVKRVISGERSIWLGTAERRAATRILTRRGWSLRLIADTLGVTEKTISRYRAEWRNET